MGEISEEDYLKAKEVVDKYNKQQIEEVKRKMILVDEDLKEFFKDTDNEWYLRIYGDVLINHSIHVYFTEPYYDEDYSGEYDELFEKIGEKHGIRVSIESGAWVK